MWLSSLLLWWYNIHKKKIQIHGQQSIEKPREQSTSTAIKLKETDGKLVTGKKPQTNITASLLHAKCIFVKKKPHPSLNNIKITKQFICLIPSQRRCLVRHNSIKLFCKLPERKSQEYLFTLYLIYRIKIALKNTGPTGLFLLILLKTILNPEKSGFRNNILVKFLWLVNH